MQGFSILSNHGKVVAALLDDPSADGPKLAMRIGVSLSTARQVLRDLQRDGFVAQTPTTEGRRFVVDADAMNDVHGLPIRAADIGIIDNHGIRGLLVVLRGCSASDILGRVPQSNANLTLLQGEPGD